MCSSDLTKDGVHFQCLFDPDKDEVLEQFIGECGIHDTSAASPAGTLDAAELLELTVSQMGHVTKVAHDGATAISIATQFAPDVVFLDIGLPVMNGYTVVRAMREMPQLTNVYIVAVTGWGQEEDRRKARDAGFNSHFTKPLSPTVLQDLLSTIEHRGVPGQT